MFFCSSKMSLMWLLGCCVSPFQMHWYVEPCSRRAGVYSNSYDAALNVKNGFPVFSTVIEANSVMKQKDQFAAFKLTDEDRQELHRLARDPRIGEPVDQLLFLYPRTGFDKWTSLL